MAGGSTKVVITAFLMNFGIAISKFVGFFLTGSSAMMAEGVHSVADTTNQVFLYLGLTRSKKEATARHQFGYGMEQYIWSFIVAILIFALGGIFSMYEGIHKLMHPSDKISNVNINLIILGIGILLEGYSTIIATKELRKKMGKGGLMSWIRKSKDQVLLTVVFEDYAALFGLTIAMLGLIMYKVTELIIFDTIATITIGVLLGLIAVFLYTEARSLLVGEAASPEDQEKIKKVFNDHEEVVDLRELLTMHLSAEEILVNAHVKFRNGLTLEQVEDVIDELEAEITKQVPEVFKIFIETHQNDEVQPLQPKKATLRKGKKK